MTKDSLTENLPLFFGLKVLKFHLLIPVYGLTALFQSKRIYLVVLFLLLLPFLSFVLGYDAGEVNYLRTFQLIFIFLFLNGILFYRKKFNYLSMSTFGTVIFGLFAVYDYVMGNYINSSKTVFGFKLLSRYVGPLGEPNFSAFALLAISLIQAKEKRYKLLFINLIIMLMLGSRATLIAIFLFIVVKILHEKSVKISKFFVILNILAFAAFPVVYGLSSRYLSEKINDSFRIASSERTELYRVYSTIASENPIFGKGYMNGYNTFLNDMAKYKWYKKLEQHSSYLHLLTDFGVIGVILIVIIFSSLYRVLTFNGFMYVFPMLINMSFINTFNEVYIYILISYLLTVENLKLRYFDFKERKIIVES